MRLGDAHIHMKDGELNSHLLSPDRPGSKEL